jgi:hypothetical protein
LIERSGIQQRRFEGRHIIEVAATYVKHWQARQAVSIRFTVTSEWRAEWWRKSNGMQASFIRKLASSSPTWCVQPSP